tara:strand:- start:12939 stop:13472 length:534 start_codon:yes stop_codon:yes gene_type:complete
MPTLNIQIATEKVDTATFKKPSQNRENLKRIASYIEKIATGKINASVDISDSATAPVAASGTLTLVSAIATDVAVIGTETFTATSTPTLENHWEIDGADDTADALSLATAINAHSVTGLNYIATVAAGVVTITARMKGSFGNELSISSVDSTITASGAFLTGGTGGGEDAPESFSKT